MRYVRSFTTLIASLLLLFGLVSGCNNTPASTSTPNPEVSQSAEQFDTAAVTETSFTEQEVQVIVDEMVSSGSDEALAEFTDEELESFVDSLQEYGIYPDLDDMSAPPPSSLPWCGSYWGHYATAETIEQRNSTSGLLYHVGPNCYMWAPDSDTSDALHGDCSSASDNDTDDFMLSFYFGYHSESPGTLKSMLRWTSSSSWVRLLLGNLSGRLYDQTAGDGADNYNVYTCVDDYFDPYLTTFDLRKF